MTLSDLRTAVRQNEAFDLSSRFGTNPTNDNYRSVINHALRITSRKLHLFDPMVTLTLTAEQAAYDIRDLDVVSKRVVKPLRVIINGNQLFAANHVVYGLWSFDELERLRQSWRTDTSATPTKAAWSGSGTSKIYLHPKPNSTVVADANNYIAGFILAPDLAADDDVPQIPEELHEMVAYLAAFHGSLPNASEQEGWQRLSAYKSEWTSMVEEIGRESERTATGTMSLEGWGEPDFMLS